jgi:hypothetical protein
MAKKRMTMAEHRERARLLRTQAIAIMGRRARQELMLAAIEHEAIAEELERLEADENSD